MGDSKGSEDSPEWPQIFRVDVGQIRLEDSWHAYAYRTDSRHVYALTAPAPGKITGLAERCVIESRGVVTVTLP